MVKKSQPSCWDGFSKLFPSRKSSRALERIEDNGADNFRQGVYTVEQLLKALPSHAGCGASLRNFWSSFCAVDMRHLLVQSHFSLEEAQKADDMLTDVHNRCLLATYPFQLVIELLLNKWKPCCATPHVRGKSRDAVNAASTAALNAELVYQQWDMILVVQRVLGRLNTPAPRLPLDPNDIQARREQYLCQARAFQFIAAAVTRSLESSAKSKRKDVSTVLQQQIYRDKVNTLIMAQQAVPLDWRKSSESSLSQRRAVSPRPRLFS